jgi:4-hydroxy-2-oxoheptanedioate aldolase
MTELPRLNGIIKALEEGGAAFVGSAPGDGAAGTSAPYDGALFEMEHGPYDIRALQEGLQSMLDRRQIAQRGIAPTVTPIVRIPPNQGQSNWIAKQVLDIGVYGIIWPHVDTAEDAYNAVAAMRYPRVEGRPLREPFGRRGDAPTRAVTYWGITQQAYTPGPTCGP